MVPRKKPFFGFIVWGLLSLWMFFGCLEFSEQLHVVPEVTTEEQDVDADALLQMATGLKSDVASLEAPGCTSVTAEITEPIYSPSVSIAHQLEQPYDPPSLRRHQKLSVYRI